MKNLFALVALVCFCFSPAIAQDNNNTSVTQTSAESDALLEATPTKVAPVSTSTTTRKMKEAKRIDASYQRPVIEMTDEYIDNQIAEIQKVIDKNEGNEEFNLSGYQKRIKHLESCRPKK